MMWQDIISDDCLHTSCDCMYKHIKKSLAIPRLKKKSVNFRLIFPVLFFCMNLSAVFLCQQNCLFFTHNESIGFKPIHTVNY